MATLVITEKSSQVTAIGALFQLKREGRASTGIYEGIEMVVFPLSGHILDIIAITSKKDDISLLPKLPAEDSFMERGLIEVEEGDDQITIRNKENSKKIYNAFKVLLNKVKIDHIIVATDPDYEGCGIALEVLQEFNLMDHKINFMNISNINPKKLKIELNKALSGNDALNWRTFAYIAHIRGEINNRTGIDISHYLMTLTGGKTTFGPQQTRALKLIVDRYLQNKAFDRSRHYRIRAKTNMGDFLLKLDEDKVTDRQFVGDLYQRLKELRSISVTEVEIKKLLKGSPAWYDGADIGTEVAEIIGKDVNELISKDNGLLQKMYEEGKITYPRGEAKGKMPISQFEEQQEIALAIAEHYGASRLDVTLKKEYLWRNDDEGIDGEIVNHTPCTIASKDLNFSTLSTDEKAVIDMAAKMLLSCFYPENKINSFTIQAEGGGVAFEHKSVTDVDLGWKELYGKEKRVNAVPDDIARGDRATIDEVLLEEYTKDPPPLYTKKTLIKDMKKKKIGAESTFASLVDKVVDPARGYAEIDKRYIIPTTKGLKLLELIPASVVNILSLFEEVIHNDLLSGKLTLDVALRGRRKIIKEAFEQTAKAIKDNPALFEELKAASEAASERKFIVVGVCPVCGGNVVDYGGDSRAYVCENRKSVQVDGKWKAEGCQVRLSKKINNDKLSYSLSIKMAQKLLLNQDVKTKVHWKSKDIKIDNILRFDINENGNATVNIVMST